MGTNYYFNIHSCPHCGRSETYHIGKCSGGWQFSFQAYPDGLAFDGMGSATAPIMSWSDWKKVVVRAPDDKSDPLYKVPWGHISDEYGNVIAPEEFEEIVESTAGMRNHYDYIVAEKRYDCSLDFKDKDGWSFGHREFS